MTSGDAEAIAEAVQRPTMRFVATKTGDQLDLQALHRVRERLVGQRTGIINQIRAFLLERGVAVRQGLRFLRIELPGILAKRTDVLSPRMLHLIEGLADDWHRLDERIEVLSSEIGALACGDPACDRLMTVPGIGPIQRDISVSKQVDQDAEAIDATCLLRACRQRPRCRRAAEKGDELSSPHSPPDRGPYRHSTQNGVSLSGDL